MMSMRLSALPADMSVTPERDGVCLGLSLIAAWRNSGTDAPGNPVVFVLWLRSQFSGCVPGEVLRQEAAARMVLPLCFADGPRLQAAMEALSPVADDFASSASRQPESVLA